MTRLMDGVDQLTRCAQSNLTVEVEREELIMKFDGRMKLTVKLVQRRDLTVTPLNKRQRYRANSVGNLLTKQSNAV